MDQPQSSPTIADYLAAVKHRPWLVALSTMVFAGLAFVGLGRGVPVYQSNAEVLLRSTEAQEAFDTTNASANRNRLANEVRFANGDVLRSLVIERLDLGIEPEALKVNVQEADDADLLIFSSIATTADKAADLANTHASLYVEERRRRAVESYTGAIATLEQQIEDSRTERERLNTELTSLRVDIAGELEGSVRRLELEQELAQREAELNPTLNAIEAEEATLLNALSTLRVSSELAKTGTAEIVSEAFPGQPNSSRRYPSIFIGAVLGLVAGAVAAVSLERLSDTIRTPDDLTRRFPNVATLGSLPTSSMAPKELGPQTRSRPTAPFAEAILQIRASIRFLTNEDEIEMITVTSPNAGEGKTTLSTSLAWAMAALSDRVVLIDADLRRPTVHEHFPIENGYGTTEYVRGVKTLPECAVRFSEQPDHFALLTSGGRVENPADLMANPSTLQRLRAITSQGRVVVDGAPILPVSDSRSLSSASDLTILVVRIGSTKLAEVEEALKRIRLTGGRRVAFVVNGVSADATPYVASRRRWRRSRADELPTLRVLVVPNGDETPISEKPTGRRERRRIDPEGRAVSQAAFTAESETKTESDEPPEATADRRQTLTVASAPDLPRKPLFAAGDDSHDDDSHDDDSHDDSHDDGEPDTNDEELLVEVDDELDENPDENPDEDPDQDVDDEIIDDEDADDEDIDGDADDEDIDGDADAGSVDQAETDGENGEHADNGAEEHELVPAQASAARRATSTKARPPQSRTARKKAADERAAQNTSAEKTPAGKDTSGRGSSGKRGADKNAADKNAADKNAADKNATGKDATDNGRSDGTNRRATFGRSSRPRLPRHPD